MKQHGHQCHLQVHRQEAERRGSHILLQLGKALFVQFNRLLEDPFPFKHGGFHGLTKSLFGECPMYTLEQGCQTYFPQGPHRPRCCFQRAEIILGLYKCNYSLTVKELKLHSGFEGNRKADVAPSENEFDTPELEEYVFHCSWVSVLVYVRSGPSMVFFKSFAS